MKKIEIFDPAMCCSTGVCGPSVNPELIRVAAVVENNTGIEKQIVAKETRLCFLSSFIDKEKNELYNRPSYHYGDR